MVRDATCAVLVLLGSGPKAWPQQVRDSGSVRDRFADATTAQLDSLYGPLLYLMQPDERGAYPTLTPSGKRDYLRRFCTRPHPTPGTAENELEADLYPHIAEANRRFRDGGASQVPGRPTGRGRI